MRAARAKRGERATPAEEGDPQESLSESTYAQVLKLEQLLLTTIQSKGPFDPNVRILRSNIRELFEAIILEDHEFAELHDVEQSLWRLHHTCIEEFRVRMRRSGPPVGTSTPGNKPTVRREHVQKIAAVFRSYLAEATGFYHDLILKIGAKHGLSQDDLSHNLIIDKNLKKDEKRIAEIRRCQLSCHRCLIYLGDLARYKESHGDGDGKIRDWSIAAGFYVKAVSLWPASGNPYHQLAVLATYIGDEMLAVYHYFRSLASETPFLTAKDNLVVLFEKNRHSYLRLSASSAENSSQTAKLERGGKVKIKEQTQVSHGIGDEGGHSDSQSSEQKAVGTDFMKNFRVHFVRLNGILFTRTSLEAFSEVHSSVLSDLKELLMVKEADEAVSSPCSLTSGRNWGTGPNVLLQLISILIFSVHNINVGTGPESHQPTYAEILQRPVILAHAFIALFECVGFILQHCAKLEDPSDSLFLPAILVVMEWLSCRPEITAGSEAKEKEGTARTFFWKNFVNFMNRFTAGNQKRLGADDMNDRVTLWEDFELWGFTPLLPIQHKLDYVKKPDMGLGCLRERLARVKRLKFAAKVVSNMFDGNDKGMHYDDETDKFYLTGEKMFSERKHVGGVLPAETVERAPLRSVSDFQNAQQVVDFSERKHVDGVLPAETVAGAPLRSVRDSQNSQQVVDPESTSAKVTLPVEEEDEEVIVFKPSSKLNQFEPIRLPVSTVDWGGGASFTMQPSRSLIPSSVNWQPQDVKINSSLWSSELHKLAPVTGSFGVQSGPNLAMAKGFPFLDPSLGSLQSMGLANAAQNLSESNSMPTHSMEPLLLNSLPQIKPRFQEPINVIADNSLIQSGSNLAMAKRFPFMDPSLGSLQSMGLASAAQNLSGSASMPMHSMEPRLIDARVQIKPRLQESINVIAENNFGSLQAKPDFAKLKPNPGTPIDSEKPARRVTNLPSNMRPPPGFGPLPARPPLSLSATTLFQASQQASSAFATANASLQQNTVVDQSEPLSVEEYVDDYAWLDGYTPPKKV